MNPITVHCQNLKKQFADFTAVADVSFTVGKGELLALVGPSGCGKTTALRLMAGFERLDAGRVTIAGQLVDDGQTAVPPEKRRVGMVFQDYAIFPHLSVADNVAFGLNGGRKRNGARVDDMLTFVGLEGLGERMPHELSGGQQQRVALARALAPEPAVLLLDEPFSNLDAALRREVRAEVRTLLKRSGVTAVFVTHDQEEALFMGDQVAVMRAGRLEQMGPPELVFHQPRTRFVAEFLGSADFVPGTAVAAGVETPLGLLPQPVSAPLGAALEVAVRPDDIFLYADSEEAHGRLPANGRVLDRQFLGIAYLYAIGLADGTTVHSWQPHTVNVPLGTAVRVGFRHQHTFPCFYGGVAC